MSTLYVLYGSATGNAEGIAKDLADRTPPPHFSSIVCKPMENFKKISAGWENPPVVGAKHGVILISSTTGNGDFPENAGRFARYIKRKQTAEVQPFKHCAFAVLGLGDTNYDQFCAAGKALDKKLAELGGARAKKLACADEATGLEDVVEPWIETVFSDIENACKGKGGTQLEKSDATPRFSEPTRTKSSESIHPEGTKSKESHKISQDRISAAPKRSDDNIATAPGSGHPLFILYGSETGNSEQIAKDLAASYELILSNPDARTIFPSVICCELDQFKKKCLSVWEQEPAARTKHGLIIIASTTGNGDPPENANRFMRFVKRKQTVESQPFKHVNFAVLGLGDTNYDQFCNTGKILDKKLAELGGTRIKNLCCADEATGLEDTVDPWVASILSEMTQACRGGDAERRLSLPSLTADDEEEKKTDFADDRKSVTSTTGDVTSRGAKIVRSMLSLQANQPMVSVERAMLPPLGAKRSSCELVKDCDGPASSQESTFDDEASISSSASGGAHYSIHCPLESRVLASRYLTSTPITAAEEVANRSGYDGIQSNEDFFLARSVFDSHFDLAGEGEKAEMNGKRVIEMTLSLPDDYSFAYQPGDALGLIVSNTPEAVTFVLDMLISRHGISPGQKVSIDSKPPITVEETVREKIDLCSVLKSKRVVRSLAQFATDPEDMATLQFLSSKHPESDSIFNSFIVEQRRSVLDLLQEFPSCQNISLEGLLGILPAIPPRYYSICSSPLEQKPEGTSLTVAFSVVDYLTPSFVVNGNEFGHRRVRGVATGQLEAMCAPLLCKRTLSTKPCVKIFPRPTTNFRLPASLDTDIILIGPGTGIAPFMGFLSHRQAQTSPKQSTQAANAVAEEVRKGGHDLEAAELSTGEKEPRGVSAGADLQSTQQTGEVDVYFGCRHADHDWLYKKEMKSLQSQGIISNLYTTFSRDGLVHRYVQDAMKHGRGCPERVASILLERGGKAYICGDGNRMARDVQESIIEILSNYTKGGKEHGRSLFEEMKSKGQILLDIWS